MNKNTPEDQLSDIERPETRLLRLVSTMSEELHPGQKAIGPITLDLSLEKDLGFDSLSRMELIHRVEVAFEITLGEQVLIQAETPRDLLGAATKASGRENIAPPTPPTLATLPAQTQGGAIQAPAGLTTLNQVLAWYARHQKERTHIHLLSADDETIVLSYGELWTQAREIAFGLLGAGLGPGETVIIMLPTGVDYFVSFYGVLLAGGVPVPVYPPGRPQQLEEHIRRHGLIADNAQAGIMITVPEAKVFSRLLSAQVASLRFVGTLDDLRGAPVNGHLPESQANDTAFIQYTSGSTGEPKGVVLSHANLLANIRAMGQALAATPADVFVSWLPLYHDMGLIGAWLGSLTFNVPVVVMSPLTFLARPVRWLQAISDYGGTISGAPNFAYEACLGRITDEEMAGLDLGAWRAAFCGAEPVSPLTLKRFTERFQAVGFDASAMMPVYGLAENSVGLAFTPLGRGPLVDKISRQTFLQTGRAEPAGEAEKPMEIPSCGPPIPHHQIRVIDDSGSEVADRVEGGLQFKGPSATTGYFRNGEATAALFDGDWLNSGDLAYTVAGEIFLTGRQKDMIIRAGRNIFPAELEAAIGDIDGVQKGNVAVFASADPVNGTERLIVLCEARRRSEEAQQKIRHAINNLAIDLVGSAPDDIVLAPPRSVPKTSSGKIRRQAAKALFETGDVGAGRAADIRLQAARLILSAAGPVIRRLTRRLRNWIRIAHVGGVMAALAPVLWLVVAVLPVVEWRWFCLRPGLRLFWRAIGVRLTVTGLENLPQDRAFILCSNHASYIDGGIILSALPGRFSFVAKGELKSNFFLRIFLQNLGTLFIDRFAAEKSVSDAGRIASLVANGCNLAYFPEGTLTRMAGLLPFQLGAFTAAAETGAPIVPIVIRGSRQVLRDESIRLRAGLVQVRILPPLDTSALENSDNWSAAVKLRDQTRTLILSHAGEPDLAHVDALSLLKPDDA